MKKRTLVIIICFVILLLLALFVGYRLYEKNKSLSEIHTASELYEPRFLKNIVINGREFSKTSFCRLAGAKITGSDENATDTVPATRIGFSENPAHVLQTGVFCRNTEITLDSFIIGKYEVSVELYKAVMEAASPIRAETEPSYFKDAAAGENAAFLPVERLSWYDAVYFCNTLSGLCGYDSVYTISDVIIAEECASIASAIVSADMSKNGFRLPTEAEWEFAARGGNQLSPEWGFTYAGSNEIAEVAWYCTDGNYNVKTENDTYTRIGFPHEIGLKKANSIGIFDMTGNVQEWCWDSYGTFDTVFESRKKVQLQNPSEPYGGIADATVRTARGGSWYRVEGESTINYRLPLSASDRNIGCGIRLVRRPYAEEMEVQ